MAAPPGELVSTETRDLVGRRVGRYEICAPIPGGGRGQVYRGQDTTLGRDVAIKRVAPRLRSNPEARSHILKEAQRASALNCPNIITVHEVVEFEDELLLVMEFLEGQNLRARMRNSGPLAVAPFLDIAIQITKALDAAHRHNIIHRDIKPENVMIMADGFVKVVDFGLAVQVADPTSDTPPSTTDTPVFAGTPGYMAPEVLLEQEVDTRSDIFSLGVVFYEMLAGEHPFRNRKPATATMHKAIRGCPPELQRIVSKMLANNAAERYATAADLLVDLKRFPTGSLPEPYWVVIGNKRLLWLAAAVILVLLAVLAARYLYNRPPPFAARDWVLIADFENSTGDPVFDKTLNEAFGISLQQSSYVNVLPRERIFDSLKRMEREDVTRIDEALGREICQREGVRVLLAGRTLRVGDAYHIWMRAVEPSTGRLLFAVEQQFRSKEQVFEKVDALSGKVREHLGESLASIKQNAVPLAKVTTRSLEALQLYSAASDDMARNKVEEAAKRLQAALMRDPEFAMARYQLATVYQILGNRHRETEEIDRSYALRERVSDRERLFIEAAYLGIHGRELEQIQRFETIVSLYPDDETAHFELAMAYSGLDRSDKAINELRSVLRLNPYFTDAYAALVIRLAYANDTGPALQVYNEAVRRGLGTAKLEWGHGMALFGADRLEEARRVFASMNKDPAYGNIGRIYTARIDMYEGKFSAAAAHLEHDVLADVSAGNRSPEVLRRYLLARSLLFLGRKSEAIQQFRKIEAEGEPPDLQGRALRWLGTEYARMGDLRAAKRVAARLNSLNFDGSDPYDNAAALTLRGEVLRAEGNLGESVQAFQQALAVMRSGWTYDGLARTYAQQKDWVAARDAWLEVIAAKGQILRHDCSADWVIAHLELARAYRELGDRQRAGESYERFLKLWERADALGLVGQARAELVALSSAN